MGAVVRGWAVLSYVVPLYNEADGVGPLWDALCASGDRMVADGLVSAWEAVIVDDGSTDRSSDLLDALARTDRRCRVVHHVRNSGIGRAMHSGFDAARGDVALYTDADLPFDLSRLGGLLGPVLDGEADLVVGRRIGRTREGLWRGAQSIAYNALVRTLLALPVSDVNFACKVAGRGAFPTSVRSRSGFFDAEWLDWAHRRGLRIRQVRVEFEPRRIGVSSVGSAEVLALLRELVSHRRLGRVERVGESAATT